MEPIAYIISLFYSIVGWLYFMFMRHAFDLEPAGEFWAKHFKVCEGLGQFVQLWLSRSRSIPVPA
jgi:hypothetical protein